jgi:hypothetical protein
MTASGGFSPVDLGPVDPSWTPQATGDFNADGQADILWRNIYGDVGVWTSNGGATSDGFDKFVLSNVDPNWVIQGTGDFNGDGTSDVVWRNTNGDTGLWYMSSDGSVAEVDLEIVVDPSWSIQGVGDFNADNLSDLLWRNTNGEVGYWLSNGGSSGNGFTPVDFGNVDSSWLIQGVGDFNGDGVSDIVWRNTNGDVGIWFMNADGGYSTVDLGGVDPSWAIQAVGDYNGSGEAGILWRNANGDVGEWLATGGVGFNGFDEVVLANADLSWNIVGGNPPAVMPVGGPSPVRMAHAMAAMDARGADSALIHVVTSQAANHPMIAAPAPSFA